MNLLPSFLRRKKPVPSIDVPPGTSVVNVMMPKSRSGMIKTVLSTILILLVLTSSPIVRDWAYSLFPSLESLDLVHLDGERASDSKILVVRVDGVILGSNQGGGLFGNSTNGYEVQQILKRAAKDERIKGVIVRLSTPGGVVYGAMAIFEGIEAYRHETGKPIFAHVEGISASGGVLAMVGADEIYAEPGSLTGSIGVTMGALTYYDDPTSISGGLLQGGVETRNGIRSYPLVAGKGKNFGSPFHEPTAEELAVIQRGLDLEYERFVDHVSIHRAIEPDVIRDRMGAYVFSNDDAEEFGLIDGTLTRGEMVERMAFDLELGEAYEVVQVKGRDAGLLGALTTMTGGTPVTAGHGACVTAISGIMAFHGNLSALCR